MVRKYINNQSLLSQIQSLKVLNSTITTEKLCSNTYPSFSFWFHCPFTWTRKRALAINFQSQLYMFPTNIPKILLNYNLSTLKGKFLPNVLELQSRSVRDSTWKRHWELVSFIVCIWSLKLESFVLYLNGQIPLNLWIIIFLQILPKFKNCTTEKT